MKTNKILFVVLLLVVVMLFIGLTACNDTPEVCEHVYDDGVVTTQPTCQAEGVKTLTCTKCGETTTEQVEKASHTEEILSGREATCSEAGLTQGKKCSVCDEILVTQEEIAKLAHTEQTITGTPATCTATGLTDGKKCSVCNEILVPQEEIQKLAHTEETITGTPATCTATGLTDGKKCSVCGEILVAQEPIEIVAHTEETITGTPATCTATGLTDGKKCSVCGEILVAQEPTEIVAHTEETIPAVPATCTAAGATAGKKCSVCHEVLVEPTTVPALTHNWIEGVQDATTLKAAATCTSGAIYKKVCEHCDAVATSDLHTYVVGEPIDHDFTAEVKETQYIATANPTCDQPASFYYSCSVCGATGEETFDDGDPLGHDHSRKVVDTDHLATQADCTNAATYYYTCIRCDDVSSTETFADGDPLGHDHTEKVVDADHLATPADCTNAATYYYTCTICDDISSTETFADGDSLGHNFVDHAVAEEYFAGDADCDTPKTYYVSCSRCHEATTDTFEYGEALGHDYTEQVWEYTYPTLDETGKRTMNCVREGCENPVCEETLAVLTDTNVWTKATIVSTPTYNDPAYDEYTNAEYGTVKIITAAKLTAPFDGKTYFAFRADNYESDISDYVVSYASIYATAGSVTFDSGYATATGTGYPFNGEVKFEIGEVTGNVAELTMSVTNTSSNTDVYEGYINVTSGIVVIPEYTAWKYALIIVPSDAEFVSSEISGESWSKTVVVTFPVGEGEETVMYHDGVVYFDVTSETDDVTGVTYYKQDATTIAGFVKVYEDTTLVSATITDGYEGVYLHNGVTSAYDVTVDGAGKVYMGGQLYGNYTANGDGTFDCIVVDGSECMLITLDTDAMSYTFSLQEVTITYDLRGVGDNFQDTVNAKVEITLSTPMNIPSTKIFLGWFADEDLTIPAATVYVEDDTLFAKWADAVNVSLVDVLPGDNTALTVPAGEAYADYLPAYIVGNAYADNEGKTFIGWALDSSGEPALDPSAIATTDDEGTLIYAIWEEIPAYVGTYIGGNIYKNGQGYLSASFSGTVTIDENGNMSGNTAVNGGVISVEDGEFYYNDGNYGYFDGNNSILVVAYNGKASLTYDTNVYVKVQEGESVVYTAANDSFAWNEGYSKIHRIAFEDGEGNQTRAFYFVILIENGKCVVYSDITVETDTDITSALTNLNVAGVNFTLKAEDGSVIESYAVKSTSSVVALDGYQGTYTAEGADDLVVDGNGNVTGAIAGTYTEMEENKLAVYTTANDAYYEVVLNKATMTYASTQPTALVTYTTSVGTAPEAEAKNINIGYTLPVLEDGNNVFRGWYVSTDAEETLVGETYTPTEAVTLIAKWDVKLSVTVNYNYAEKEDIVVYYGTGDTTEIANPARTDMAFGGWYTTADFQVGTEWTNVEAIDASVIIYAKWNEAPCYAGDYVMFEIGGTNTNGATSSASKKSSIFSMSPDGVMTSTEDNWPYPLSSAVSVESYDEATGILMVKNTSGRYIKFVVDETTGIIYGYRSNGTNYDTVYNGTVIGPSSVYAAIMLIPVDVANFDSVTAISSYWNGGAQKAMEFFDGVETKVVFQDGSDNVYFGVTLKDMNGVAIAADAAYNANTLYVYQGEEVVLQYGYDGTTMVQLDGKQGTYETSLTIGSGEPTSVQVTLNGVDTITYGEKTGTYSITEGNAYYDVYLEDGTEYYTLTLGAEFTATMNMPMVDVVFVTAHGTKPDDVNVNKNVAITLTELEAEGFVFRGWYDQEDAEQTLVDTSYVPTKAETTLVAKWDEQLTLTVVYGKGIENAVLYYGAGDTTAPVEPVFTDGQVFSAWYTTADFQEGTQYTPGPITVSTTIYVKWMDAVPYYGTYKGFNAYGNSGTGSFSGNKSITIDAKGNVTGNKTGAVTEDRSVNTGLKFGNYVAYHNATDGIFIFNDGTGGTDLKNDFYGYIAGATNVVLANGSTSTDQLVWNSGLSRLIRLSVTAEGTSIKYFYVNGNAAYLVDTLNVTGIEFTATTALSSLKTAGVKIEFTTSDDTDVIILSDGTDMLVPDAYMGTYTKEGDADLVIDGAGAFTLGEVTGSYTEAEAGAEYTLVGTTMKKVEGTFYKVTYEFTLSGTTYTVATSEVESDPYAVTNDATRPWTVVDNGDGTITYTAPVSTASETFNLRIEALGAITLKITFSQSDAQSNEYFAIKKNGTAGNYNTDANADNTEGYEDYYGEISYSTGNISGEITYTMAEGDYITIYHADYTRTNSDVTTFTITVL